MKDYVEIVFFSLFMVGLFFALPFMVFAIGFLDFINWSGVGGANLAWDDISRAFGLYVQDIGLWLVLGSVFAIEIFIIIVASRNHPHHTTYV